MESKSKMKYVLLTFVYLNGPGQGFSDSLSTPWRTLEDCQTAANHLRELQRALWPDPKDALFSWNYCMPISNAARRNPQ